MTVLDALRWQDQAACRGSDLSLFFGPDGESARRKAAREAMAAEFCARCPVLADCDAWSVGRPEHFGFWAGLGEDERREERRRRMRRARERRAA